MASTSPSSLMDMLATKATAFKLSQTLSSRLKFAGFKVSRGLEAKTFREVSELVDQETSRATSVDLEGLPLELQPNSPSRKRRHQGEQEGGKRARVSVTPEAESEAVELLMALSAHSTRASCSPEPDESNACGLPTEDELAERLRTSPSAPNTPARKFARDTQPDASVATGEADTQTMSVRGDTPDTILASDTAEGKRENLEQIAEAMIRFVVVSPPSPALSDLAADSSSGSTVTGKPERDPTEAPAPNPPPPAAQASLPPMKRFTPGPITA